MSQTPALPLALNTDPFVFTFPKEKQHKLPTTETGVLPTTPELIEMMRYNNNDENIHLKIIFIAYTINWNGMLFTGAPNANA